MPGARFCNRYGTHTVVLCIKGTYSKGRGEGRPGGVDRRPIRRSLVKPSTSEGIAREKKNIGTLKSLVAAPWQSPQHATEPVGGTPAVAAAVQAVLLGARQWLVASGP